jgi:hypothetical protein
MLTILVFEVKRKEKTHTKRRQKHVESRAKVVATSSLIIGVFPPVKRVLASPPPTPCAMMLK